MPRATLIVACDQPEEVAAVEAWFSQWRSALTYVSENGGCGCCVDIYDVEGPAEAVVAIPANVSAQSDWTRANPPAA